MSTIEELSVGIGDQVKFVSERHVPFPRTIAGGQPRGEMVELVAEIVALDDSVVYLHPWTADLAAFTRIQNTQTGAIYPIRAYRVGNEIREAPLEEGERLVLAIYRQSNDFSPASSV